MKKKKAVWLFDPYDFATYCSRCRRIPRTTEWTCPNCGSEMTNMPEREEKADEQTNTEARSDVPAL